jgi:ABC-type bacteriocin/lantibiotic exporter with double-glycine peptidase domain
MDLGFGKDRKSPTIARWLSIIPGIGHLYAGAYISGIIWLIFSLFIIFLIRYLAAIVFWYPIIFIIFIYIPLVSYTASSASKLCAEIHSRKALNEEFSAKKRTKEKIAAQEKDY